MNKETEKLEEARILRNLQRNLADARFDSSNKKIKIPNGNWSFKDGKTSVIETNNESINISWDLSIASYRYSGRIINRFFDLSYFASDIITIKSERKLEKKGMAYGYISNDCSQIFIYNQ